MERDIRRSNVQNGHMTPRHRKEALCKDRHSRLNSPVSVVPFRKVPNVLWLDINVHVPLSTHVLKWIPGRKEFLECL